MRGNQPQQERWHAHEKLQAERVPQGDLFDLDSHRTPQSVVVVWPRPWRNAAYPTVQSTRKTLSRN